MIRFLLLSVAVLAMTGCARMIQGSSQDVTIETPGADGATCFLENKEMRYKFYAPQTITLTKPRSALNVRCLAPGNREKTVVVPLRFQEETFMNAANGLIPGMLYDYESNAMYKLPPVIVVDFTDMPPQPMPLPKYDRLLRENPQLRGWEEFRPGLPALQRDLYDAPVEMKRREIPVSSDEMSTEGEALPPPEAIAPSVPVGNNADGLTRAMNPSVFDGNAPMPLLRDDDWVK
jgi:hypothetical protein